MRWTVAIMSALAALPAQAVARPRCGTPFVLETTRYRGQPMYAQAKAMPIVDPEEDSRIWAEDMDGPFNELKHACADCTEILTADKPYDQIAVGGTHVAVKIHGSWWMARTVDDTACKNTYDGTVRDVITRPVRGSSRANRPPSVAA